MNDKYKFTEKERDVETGYDYFGARYYDSELGRWLSVDPMSSSRPGLSPYNYCQNNPLVRIDPDGMRDIANSAVGGDDEDDKKKNIVETTLNSLNNFFDTFFSSSDPTPEVNVGNTPNIQVLKIQIRLLILQSKMHPQNFKSYMMMQV